MTSITLLPTGIPVRPSVQPASTPWPSSTLIGLPTGDCVDGQDEPNTWPVRQFSPTYCATITSPLGVLGPVPLIRVVTDSFAGGACFGTVMTGACPAFAVTVGSAPPPCETDDPVADAPCGNCWSKSMTQTRVSDPLMPSCDWPAVP